MDNIATIPEIAELQEKTKQTNEIRDQIVKKLMPVVETMEIIPGGEKSTITDAKMNVIKTVDELLKSSESAITSTIKIIMQQKNGETESKHADLALEILKNISTNIPPKAVNVPNLDEADIKLQEAYERDEEMIINPEEMSHISDVKEPSTVDED